MRSPASSALSFACKSSSGESRGGSGVPLHWEHMCAVEPGINIIIVGLGSI